MSCMFWPSPRYFRILPLVVVALLLVCHVGGRFCAMSPPNAMATVVIEATQAQNAVAMNHHCADQLVPSTERFDTPEHCPVAQLDTALLLSTQSYLSSSAHNHVTLKFGVPLFSLLSNFRI